MAMTEPDDVSKLFALFDGATAKRYHAVHVHKADQQRETLGRRPLFKPVRPAAAEPSPEPADLASDSLKSMFKRLERLSEPIAPAKPSAALAGQPAGSIRSLFDRLCPP